MNKFQSVKDSDFVNDVCTLVKNTPKLVFPEHNNKRFMIREESTNETLYVIFKLDAGEDAIIGYECYIKQDGKESAKADLMCVYSKPPYAVGYAYELKKTIGGKKVIKKLLSQWAGTISYCKAQIPKYYYGFVVGVITENFDHNLLDKTISELEERINEHDNNDLKNSAIAIKLRAPDVNDRQELKLLKGFRDKKVEIQGSKLDIDIQVTADDKKELTLQFNGDDRPQVLRYAVQ